MSLSKQCKIRTFPEPTKDTSFERCSELSKNVMYFLYFYNPSQKANDLRNSMFIGSTGIFRPVVTRYF